MQIGRYTIQGELGRGGMGVVYRATGPGGNEVALKLLTGARQDGAERFSREARLQELLGEAEGFVPLLDLGSSKAGLFLVMPLLSGGTLRDRLTKGALDVDESVLLIRELAGALGRAHAQGVIHRDVKPDNVLFADDGRPLLADLGLAKHFRRDVAGASQSRALSVGGEMRGTLGYMAPEQLRDASNAGPAADVFALGAVLYECLCGQPAFEADSYMELIAKIASADRSPLPRHVPSWLVRVLDRALARDPKHRYPNGGAFADALRAGAPAYRRKRGAAALLLLAALGAGWLAFGAGSPPESVASTTPTPRPSVPVFASAERAFPKTWTFREDLGIELEASWLLDATPLAIHLDESDRLYAFSGGALRALLGSGPYRGPTRTLTLPLENVTGADFAADRPRLFVFGADNHMIDLTSGQVQPWAKIHAPLRLGSFGRRGMNAVGSRDRSLVLLKQGRAELPLAEAKEPPRALATSQDVVLAVLKREVLFVSGLVPPGTALRFHEPVAAAALTPSGVCLVLTQSGSLHRYDERAQELGGRLRLPLTGSCALSATDRYAVAVDRSRLVVADLRDLRVAAELDLASLGEPLERLSFSPTGALAVSTSAGRVLRFRLSETLVPRPRRQRATRSIGSVVGRHADTVTGLSVRGQEWISADMRGFVHRWDPATGRSLGSVATEKIVMDVFALGDQRVLCVTGDDLRLLDLSTGQERWRIPPDGIPRMTSLRKDQRQVAILAGGALELWALPECKRIRRIEGMGESYAAALLADGRVLAADESGGMRLLDESWSKAVWKRTNDRGPVVAVCLSRDEEVLVTGGHGGRIEVLSVADGLVRTWFDVEGPVCSLALHEGRVLVATRRGVLELWDTVTGKRIARHASPTGAQAMVAFTDDGQVLVGGTAGRLALIPKLTPSSAGPTTKLLEPLVERWGPVQGHQGAIRSLAFSEEGERVISVASRSLRSWRVKDGAPGMYLTMGIALDAAVGAKLCVASTVEGEITSPPRLGLWGVEAAGVRRSGPTALASFRADALAASPLGEVFACSRRDGKYDVFVGRGFKGDPLGTFQGSRGSLISLSREGRLLAIGSSNAVSIWDVARHTTVARLTDVWPRRMTFLPSSPPLLALTRNARPGVRVIDAMDGRELLSLSPRASQLDAIEFLAGSFDGRTLLTGFKDGQVDLWELPAGQHLARLVLDDAADVATAAAFDPRGRYVALGTARGRIVLFSLPKR